MEAKRGHALIQLYCGTTTESSEVTTDDILRAASAAAKKPSARMPDRTSWGPNLLDEEAAVKFAMGMSSLTSPDLPG